MVRSTPFHPPVLHLLLVVALLACYSAQAGGAVIEQDLQTALDAGGKIYVNVVLNSQADPREIAKTARGSDKAHARRAVQAELRSFCQAKQSRVLGLINSLEARGLAEDVRAFWIANTIRLSASREAVEALAGLDEVAGISLDAPRQILGPSTGTAPVSPGISWSVRAIEADRVWTELGYTGAGVLVAMLDTGIDYLHSDLQNRMWHNPGEIPSNGIDDDGNGYVDDYYGYDFPRDSSNPMDDNGHGTLTAGVVAGDGAGGVKTGVAPGAKLMACKVLVNGVGQESYSWEALEYAVANGADVINLSIGWIQCYHHPARAVWRSALENVMAAGVFVCAAAGNEGNAQSQYWYCPPPYNIRTPGDVPGVVTLGAVDRYDVVAPFSSVGPVTWTDESPYNDCPWPPGLGKPDVCAPGHKINSTVLGGGYSGDYYSGTSLSSPHAAGVAALMLEKNPSAPPHYIKQYMEDYAVALAAAPEVAGKGRLDAFAAVSAFPPEGDSSPPAPITDLFASPGPGCDEVTLRWTATGDDGTIGSAFLYDVRYAEESAGPIDTEAKWNSATQVTGEPEPHMSGWTQTMTVSGLTPGARYFFAIKAYDDYLNASALSNSASSYTGAVDFYAESQTTDFGSHISGDLADLEASDNSYLVLQEAVLEQGPKSKWHDELIHTWTFTVPEGHTQLTLNVEAYHTFNLDYDDFVFSYSTDGVAFTDLLTVTKRADDNQTQSAAFPKGACGTLYLRVRDTDQNRRMDHPNTLYVDQLFLRGLRSGDSNPPVFSGLESGIDAGTGGAVDLSWSGAFDPEGAEPIRYNIYQATAPGGQEFGSPTHTTYNTQFTATGLTDGLPYYFVVRAQDACGNEDSNSVEMSATPSAPVQCAMFIGDIDLLARLIGINWKCVAHVPVSADEGCSGDGASVEVSWYLNESYFGVSTAIADAGGVATLISPPHKAVPGDIFKMVVTSVSKDGVAYDPARNVETEESAIVNSATPATDAAGPEWVAPRSFGSGSFAFGMNLENGVRVSAAIYDVSGRLVKRLAGGVMGPGPVRFVWDGSDAGGRSAPSGVYYYVIRAGGLARQGKLVVAR
jgi:subtilisin family serine protease